MPKKSPFHQRHPALQAVGEAVRGLRMEAGRSQEALALEAEIDRSYLGGIERGEHNITLTNLSKLSAALGVTAAELLKRAGL